MVTAGAGDSGGLRDGERRCADVAVAAQPSRYRSGVRQRTAGDGDPGFTIAGHLSGDCDRHAALITSQPSFLIPAKVMVPLSGLTMAR